MPFGPILQRSLRPGVRSPAFKNAIIPAESCEKVLSVSIALTAIVVSIGNALLFITDPSAALRNLFFIINNCLLVLVIVMAVFRGLPSMVRYVVFSFILLATTTDTLFVTGPTPTWALFTLLFLTITGLLFGVRRVLWALVLVGALFGTAAAFWIAFKRPRWMGEESGLGQNTTDWHSPAVWVRLSCYMFSLLGLLLFLVRLVVSEMENAKNSAMLAMRRLGEEQQLRANAMYNAAIGMAVIAPDGKWTDVNPALCQIVGYGREELLAMDIRAICDPEDGASELVKRSELLDGMATDFEMDARYFHRSGRAANVHLTVSLQRDAENRPLSFVAQFQDITARKHIEDERERLARAVEALDDGAYWIDGQNRIVYVNDGGCRALGYTRKELIGNPLMMVSPDATPERLSVVWGRLRAQNTYTGESVHRRKDGTTFPVEIVLAYVKIGNEEFNCGFAHDITERRRAENELRESEKKFSMMFQSAPALISISDLSTGVIIDVNTEVTRVTGFRRDEVVGRRGTEIGWITAANRQLLVDTLQNQGRIAGLAMSFSNRQGGVIEGLVNGDKVEIDGRACLLVVISDITERIKTENALDAAAERLALALRASKFGVWRHNLQTGYTEWDSRMFEIFGLPSSTKAPSLDAILERVAEEDRRSVRQSWMASPACNRSYQLRFQIIRPDGSLNHIELHGIVHDDSLGQPEWSIGVAGDITEIVEATSESVSLRAKLQQSQKMEALGTLAAGVAHDFNNLLTGINGFVELASTSLAPGHEASELLVQARHGAMSARDLVRRILNFSRSNNDQKRALVDAVEVIRDTAPLIAAALPGNVSLSIALSCETAPVLADSGQLQQVLMNLCTNAGHALGKKAGKIQIGAEICELGASGGRVIPHGCDAGQYFKMYVRDTGSGMNEATRNRIFEPYFTTKAEGQGTGLGLSIVHDIVAAHEGGMEVETTLGKGSTFTVFLPVSRIGTGSRRLANKGPLLMGNGQRILIVDDDPSVGLVTRMTLQRSAYEPEMFTSACEALKRFEMNPQSFDLVIVDQNMPETSGLDFVRRARLLVPKLPIIMMSGRFENAEAISALEVDLLKKPFEITNLIDAVRSALDRAGKRMAQS